MTIEYKCGFQMVEDGVAYCCLDYPFDRSPYKLDYPFSTIECREMLVTGICPAFKTLEEVESSTWIHRMMFD